MSDDRHSGVSVDSDWSIKSALLVQDLLRVATRNEDVLLLDLGGVLTPDPWQTILLTPGKGVSDRLGIPRQEAAEAAEQLWPDFSLRERVEQDWWRSLADLLGVQAPASLVREVERELLVPLPGAVQAVRTLARTWAIGIISDNTSFWFEKQRRMLPFEDVESGLEFLSFREGIAKSTAPTSLFDLAAASLAGSGALVIDDRPGHCERARAAGLRAMQFTGDGWQP
jgi:FMN phosphatase YigB (HAD superfamily)